MNDQPRRVLHELVAKHGLELCEQRRWRMCREMLEGRCKEFSKEVTLIGEAQQCEVAEEILTRPKGMDGSGLDDLVEKLRQHYDGMTQDEARWAVEAWAVALGVLSIPEPVPPPQPEPAPPIPKPEPPEPPTPTPPAPIPAASFLDDPNCFYLGREYDLAEAKVLADRPFLYDSRDLLTHGVVVGMTGSGKTGLCISLLEEAALDGIPCIIIDPKGDLANLLLTFPDLTPEKFQEWLNPDEARLKGVSVEEYAKQLAGKWRRGVEESGQPVERIRKLNEAGEWRVYTPGSEAGLSLSILQNFTAPKGLRGEDLGQKVEATTTALLGLTGISADPVQSREHVLIARLIMDAWDRGHDLSLGNLVDSVVEPPMDRIGNLDLEEFYPQKDRTKLAIGLNNILASPSFTTWVTGEPLDLERLLKPGKSGKPRHLIFYVAHLDDAQRMFFITLLVEEVLNWTRRQAGTTNLRSVLYFDEVAGYLPPHPHNPPSKTPIITLFKQARAFGVGLLLATQNPVDLDYKALSNAGTWFVGKLQTERDKKRLLEGLEGVAAESGTLGDRAHLKKVIAALGNRVFLCHNVHRGQSLLFQTRWALSFLGGPMTRDQIAKLMEPLREKTPSPIRKEKPAPIPAARPAAVAPADDSPAPVAVPMAAVPAEAVPVDSTLDLKLEWATPPPASPSLASAPASGRSTSRRPEVNGVQQFFLPLANPVRPAGLELVYEPRLLAFADVAFQDKKRGVEHRRKFRCLSAPPGAGAVVDWFRAETCGESLVDGPEAGAKWGAVPVTLDAPKKLKALEKQFADYLYRNARITVLVNRTLELVSGPDDDPAVFQDRCRRAAIAERDRALANDKIRYGPRFKALGAELPEEEPEKSEPSSLLGSVTSWLGEWSMASMPDGDRRRSEKEKIKLGDLKAEWQKKRDDLDAKWRRAGDECEEVTLAPRKTDVNVTHFGLAWVPCWEMAGPGGLVDLRPAYRL